VIALAAAATGIVAANSVASAATYTYTPSTTADSTVNWSDWSTPPVSDIDTQLVFGDNGTPFDAAVNAISSNNVAAPFILNSMVLNGTGPAAGASPTMTVQGSSLAFKNNTAATGPTITNSSAASTTGLTYTVANDMVLYNNIIFNGNGTNNITFSGVISESGGAKNLVKQGTSTITLSGANSYTGTTTIGKYISVGALGGDGGTVRLSGDGKISNNDLTIYNGKLDLNGTTQSVKNVNLGNGGAVPYDPTDAVIDMGTNGVLKLAGNVTAGSQWNTKESYISNGHLVLTGNRTFTANFHPFHIGSAIENDVSARGLTKAGTAEMILSGANTYTGNTTVSAGTLTLANTGSLLLDVNPLSNTQLLGTGTLNLNGTLRLDVTDITDAGAWTLVNTGTLAETYGATFGIALAGVSDTPFTSVGDVWSLSQGGRNWQFTESTGVLTMAVPEPSSLSLVGLGAMLFLRRRRRAI
jgi:autotransporter-associated beta strand protein